jgi:arginyl-tRNA synthetase
MIRKSDGGYGYDSTDLAAVKHRVEVERAERIIYVTDLRQKQHFDMVFAGARKAGWAPDSVSLEHVGFGMVLGKDGRPFKTRLGGTVKLKELLDEAETRAAAAIGADDERRRELAEEQRAEIARVVGLGAVKYTDLSHDVTNSYVFDWDVMLALEGNTAPYLQYAYARIRSIGRKAGIDFEALPADTPLLIEHESEALLAKQLLNFPGVVKRVAAELRPHHLTDYLYALSRAFSTFYDRERGVRVVDAEPAEVRQSRLRLCDLTARTLKLGLGLLGIQVLEQM